MFIEFFVVVVVVVVVWFNLIIIITYGYLDFSFFFLLILTIYLSILLYFLLFRWQYCFVLFHTDTHLFLFFFVVVVFRFITNMSEVTTGYLDNMIYLFFFLDKARPIHSLQIIDGYCYSKLKNYPRLPMKMIIKCVCVCVCVYRSFFDGKWKSETKVLIDWW